MRRRLFALLAAVALVTVVVVSSAAAAPVLVLGRDGHVIRRDDPFLTGPAVTPTPASVAQSSRDHSAPGGRARPAGARQAHPAAARAKAKPPKTVYSELARLRRTGAITASVYQSDVADYRGALAEEKHLTGTRRTELTAVTVTLHDIAARGQLTASRLPALFATLDANRDWWAHGSLLASGARVEFSNSQLVWEYYPGQGLQLQVLGSFGKADGLFTAGSASYPAMEQLLSEIIPLASQRGGGLAWEYYFSFDGGSPPWTSAMSQATGLEALSRAYQATDNPYYLQVAARALPLFTRRAPAGVQVPTARGVRFVQYTFTPQTSIINAFLQSLIGLYDYAQVSGSTQAQQLFDAGNAEAEAEVPSFDTGAWSLYQPGIEDTLDYHELVTGFLQQLCQRTSAPVYCTTAQHFTSYLTVPPVVNDLTPSVRAKRPFSLRFKLSKASHVGVVVTGPSGATVFATSASFGYGVDRFAVPALKRAGTYQVRLAATDLAGNFARTTGTLTVRR